MQTNWDLIRKTINTTIDACEKLEALQITDCEKGNGKINVGDFLSRFSAYPEGAARDIVRLRYRIADGVWYKEQKYLRELAKALLNSAIACAEIIGLDEVGLKQEFDDHVAHCGTAGKSVASHLTGIGEIYLGWLIPEIEKSLKEWRSMNKYDCEIEECPHQPLCAFYEEIQARSKQNKPVTDDA
jgi:hypothetical protein